MRVYTRIIRCIRIIDRSLKSSSIQIESSQDPTRKASNTRVFASIQIFQIKIHSMVLTYSCKTHTSLRYACQTHRTNVHLGSKASHRLTHLMAIMVVM